MFYVNNLIIKWTIYIVCIFHSFNILKDIQSSIYFSKIYYYHYEIIYEKKKRKCDVIRVLTRVFSYYIYFF